MARIVRFSPEAVGDLDLLEVYFSNSMPSYAAATCVNSIVDKCVENLSRNAYRGIKRDDIRPNLRVIEFNMWFKSKNKITVAFEDISNSDFTNVISASYGNSKF